MNLRALEAFAAVAESLNFTKAAAKLYITQPALSRLISALEEELGVKLLDRTTRQVRLTPEGEMCRPWADRILADYEGLLTTAERARRSMHGVLNIGYNPLADQPVFFVAGLSELSEQYPNVTVNLQRDYSYQLVESVLSGKLDCALVSEAYMDGNAELDFLALQSIRFYALVRKDSEYAELPSLSVKQMAGKPITMMRDSAPKTYQRIHNTFSENGVDLTEDTPVNDLEEFILRVRMGKSVGISSFGDPTGRCADLCAITIDEFPPSKAFRGLLWRKDCSNPCVPILREILLQATPNS